MSHVKSTPRATDNTTVLYSTVRTSTTPTLSAVRGPLGCHSCTQPKNCHPCKVIRPELTTISEPKRRPGCNDCGRRRTNCSPCNVVVPQRPFNPQKAKIPCRPRRRPCPCPPYPFPFPFPFQCCPTGPSGCFICCFGPSGCSGCSGCGDHGFLTDRPIDHVTFNEPGPQGEPYYQVNNPYVSTSPLNSRAEIVDVTDEPVAHIPKVESVTHIPKVESVVPTPKVESVAEVELSLSKIEPVPHATFNINAVGTHGTTIQSPIIIPSNAISAYLTVVAAGGGGSTGTVSSTGANGGSGGGSGQMLYNYPVLPGSTIDIVFGAPGVPQTVPGSDGNAAQDTIITVNGSVRNETIILSGGSGGSANNESQHTDIGVIGIFSEGTSGGNGGNSGNSGNSGNGGDGGDGGIYLPGNFPQSQLRAKGGIAGAAEYAGGGGGGSSKFGVGGAGGSPANGQFDGTAGGIGAGGGGGSAYGEQAVQGHGGAGGPAYYEVNYVTIA